MGKIARKDCSFRTQGPQFPQRIKLQFP